MHSEALTALHADKRNTSQTKTALHRTRLRDLPPRLDTTLS